MDKPPTYGTIDNHLYQLKLMNKKAKGVHEDVEDLLEILQQMSSKAEELLKAIAWMEDTISSLTRTKRPEIF